MKRLLISVVFVVFISGCASSTANIKKNKFVGPTKQNGFIFGHLDFALDLGGTCQVRFRNLTTKRFYSIEVTDGKYYIFSKRKGPWTGHVEKDFYMEIPAGEYVIKEIRIRDCQMSMSDLDIDIRFSAAPGKITYIGNLIYSFSPEKSHFYVVMVVTNGKASIGVRNDVEEATKRLRTEYPNLKGDVNISLMKFPSNGEDEKI